MASASSASCRFASAAFRSLPAAAAAAAAATCVWFTASPPPLGATRCEAPAADQSTRHKAFQEATVVSNVYHTRNTRLVTLRLPSDWNPERAPVANVLVRAAVQGEDKPVVRPYNPLSAKSGDEITLLVKRYGPDAKMGSVLHELHMGDAIHVKGPNMQWTLPDAGAVERYVFIAGGTGVTPIVQAAEGVLRKDLDATVEIFTFNDTPRDVLLRNHLADLATLYQDRVRVKNFFGMLSADLEERDGRDLAPHNVMLLDRLKKLMGYPTKDLLQKHLPRPTDFDGHVMLLVCGPAEMVAKVAGPKTKDYKQGELGGVLKDLGFHKNQVWKL